MPWHHIIPLHEWRLRINPLADRHDKDFNASDNRVLLTLAQHVQAHLFLFEITANKYDWVAAQTLSGQMTMSEAKKEAQREAGRRTGVKLRGVPKSESHRAAMRGLRPHVNQTGSRNNNARAIRTSRGNFGSSADAARELNLSRGRVTRISI